ncbi:GNAT family N-acetyltransferase [Minwuia thermotolerans]|uniref:GNAT family N-acetyltransferase n=1 Tax=Minwuia thermotolerans TaxID=2056226 RepID=A0A2M9FX96_9PROT|nr:GNAT family protein [Minwuia thermotolerans]PJK28088.1 GNAT family N-acetyltransferase [Minwuia thermotolerans]
MTEKFVPAYRTGEPLPGWKGAAGPGDAPMTGRYCTLEPAGRPAQADELYEVFQTGGEAQDWLYLPYGPFPDIETFRAWYQATCTGKDPLFVLIRDAASRRALGLASFLNIERGVGRVEVGHIHFSPDLQQSAAATEAMYLMMKRVFECGFRRYEWKCDSLNERSRRAAQRFGFSFEGVFRQHYVVKGRNRDTAWYACIDQEWPRLREAYETWLAPDNFDAEGRQKRRLSALTGPVLVQRG